MSFSNIAYYYFGKLHWILWCFLSDLNFELLIIDQSEHPQKEISLYKSPNYDYRYINLTTIGLPNNFGLKILSQEA